MTGRRPLSTERNAAPTLAPKRAASVTLRPQLDAVDAALDPVDRDLDLAVERPRPRWGLAGRRATGGKP